MKWNIGQGYGSVFDEAGKLVCTTTREYAALIVEAVNAHSPHVEAVPDCLRPRTPEELAAHPRLRPEDIEAARQRGMRDRAISLGRPHVETVSEGTPAEAPRLGMEGIPKRQPLVTSLADVLKREGGGTGRSTPPLSVAAPHFPYDCPCGAGPCHCHCREAGK